MARFRPHSNLVNPVVGCKWVGNNANTQLGTGEWRTGNGVPVRISGEVHKCIRQENVIGHGDIRQENVIWVVLKLLIYDITLRLEVKSATNTKAKSLQVYSREFAPLFSVKSSLKNYSVDGLVKSIPLYALGLVIKDVISSAPKSCKSC